MFAIRNTPCSYWPSCCHAGLYAGDLTGDAASGKELFAPCLRDCHGVTRKTI